MNLGIIARSDRGGIAAQTYELVQNLSPAKVLVVKPGKERGEMTEMYPGALSSPDPIDEESARKFLHGLEAVLTVEGWYGGVIPSLCASMGVRRIVVANPELFDRNTEYDKLLVPTNWMLEDMPDAAEVLPHPTSLERFVQRVREEVKTFYHLGSPAMLDRNGSVVVKKALSLLRNECKIIVRDGSVEEAYITKVGKAIVHVLPGHATPWYWQHWPAEADCLVLPRRYGGLCLPMQEAASQGMPVITSKVSPQKEWFHQDQLVEPFERITTGMKGGRVYYWNVTAEALAEKMDAFSVGDIDVKAASERSLNWARERSWDIMLDNWRMACGMRLW